MNQVEKKVAIMNLKQDKNTEKEKKDSVEKKETEELNTSEETTEKVEEVSEEVVITEKEGAVKLNTEEATEQVEEEASEELEEIADEVVTTEKEGAVELNTEEDSEQEVVSEELEEVADEAMEPEKEEEISEAIDETETTLEAVEKSTVETESSDVEKEEAVELNTEEDSEQEAVSEELEEVADEAMEPEKEEEISEAIDETETTLEAVEKSTVETESSDVEKDDSVSEYYAKILKKIKETLETKEWGLITNEFSNLSLHIGEGPEPDDESKESLKEFEELRKDFEERKKAHYDELNKKREENLTKKKDLLKQFGEIINEENWTAVKEVSQIKNSWDRITQIPRDEIEGLNNRFDSFMKEFESHKVDRLVKKLEKEEENLTVKLLLLDKMEALNKRSDDFKADFKALTKEFDDLHSQWRKVGRVPNEKNQMVWDRFNAAEDAFNKLRFKNDKSYRDKIEKSLQKKKKLIAEAEALVDNENIAKAARRVNKLHNAWKKTENLPQKDENELWDKFKAATDAFNEKKSDNIDVLREQEEKNYNQKLRLIEQAEAIQDADDFDKGHQTMQNLMKEWKKIGPVQRKKSSKIWKKFKVAMDVFYERRRDHFKDQRGEEKENLVKKKEILAKLKELGSHEDPVKAVDEAKQLQEEFKNAGHVPIKSKNKIWKQYREACDVIYERFRASGADLGMERELATEGVEPANRKQVIKLRKEKDVSKLEAESIQYEEAKTYFKPTNKGNKLRDELQAKIDKAGKKIETKQQRIKEINRKLRELMSSDEEE